MHFDGEAAKPDHKIEAATATATDRRSDGIAGVSDRAETPVGLDGRQIFFLFVGSALFASFIFGAGVFVGRRLERTMAVEAAAKAVTDPLKILDEIAAAEEALTFPKVLSPTPPTSGKPVRAVSPPANHHTTHP